MANSKSPIASKSRQCVQLLDRARNLWSQDNPAKTSSWELNFDEAGRFRIWANNIGALLAADRRNSLDYRLRDASKVSNRVVEFLDDLQEALEDSKMCPSISHPHIQQPAVSVLSYSARSSIEYLSLQLGMDGQRLLSSMKPVL